MIYFITFILTTLLSHIARATPACGDVAPPEELYDPTYTDAQRDQHSLPPILYNVTWTHNYDPNHSTKGIACFHIGPLYPQFKDIPYYPRIVGMSFIKSHPERCGTCWNLTAVKPPHKTISVTVIDSDETGSAANLPEMAFNLLNGGPGISLIADFKEVDPRHCRFKK